MPLVEFTPNLASQTAAPACRVGARTVAEALAEVFARLPAELPPVYCVRFG